MVDIPWQLIPLFCSCWEKSPLLVKQRLRVFSVRIPYGELEEKSHYVGCVNDDVFVGVFRGFLLGISLDIIKLDAVYVQGVFTCMEKEMHHWNVMHNIFGRTRVVDLYPHKPFVFSWVEEKFDE